MGTTRETTGHGLPALARTAALRVARGWPARPARATTRGVAASRVAEPVGEWWDGDVEEFRLEPPPSAGEELGVM
jgi:hypothetical protein